MSNKTMTSEFIRRLNAYFESKVEIPRIKIGKRQEIETLINEEAWLFAKYLRKERRGSPESLVYKLCPR